MPGVRAVATNSESLRLVFRSPHRVSRIAALDAASIAPTVTTIAPSSAMHSRLGDVTSLLGPSDTLSITLVAADSLWLSFATSTPAESLVRAHVLVVQGRTSLQTTASESAGMQSITSVPERFALYQNQPNPFGASTTIHFDLSVRSEVRLEIFDIAGRRLRTVRTGALQPGTHALVWDRRDDDGRQVRPGVYLYRIHAGSFADRRRMVLVP